MNRNPSFSSHKIAFLFLFISQFSAFGEGTKEFMPEVNHPTRILVTTTSGRDPFARYSVAQNHYPDYRLFIRIQEADKEKIYFGLGQARDNSNNNSTGVTWRIHRPDGSVLSSGTTPGSGNTGFIDTYAKAVAGPTVLNAAGYTPIVVIPDPLINGDYFITFEVSNTRTFDYCDISVVDTTTFTYRPGRIFSKNWQFRNPDVSGTYYKFYGKMFAYSNDGIVTRFDPNGLEGRDFSFACNESGCYPVSLPSMPASTARQSVEGRHTYPQFKIFVNDPDDAIYPSGTLGVLVQNSPVVEVNTHCDNGTIDFLFEVTAPGSAEITLKLSTLGLPYVDKTMIQTVATGWNTFTWDGLDGATPANLVPNGSSFNFTLTYINGMTHLPLFDVEFNWNGFLVSLIRPPSSEPAFYWDDRGLDSIPFPAPGNASMPNLPRYNFTGCYSSLAPCHLWNQGSQPGNERTINTWWYVANTSTAPVVIMKKQKPGNLGTISGASQMCPGGSSMFSVNADPNTTKYIWSWLTNVDTTLIPSINLTVPIGAPPGPMVVSVRGMNNQCPDGPASTLSVTINPIPVLSTTPTSKSICNGNSVNVSLDGTPSGLTFTWEATCLVPAISGYANGNGTIIADVLTNTGLIPGDVDYKVVPAYNGCLGDTTHYIVTVNPVPNAIPVPLSSSICSNETTSVTISGTVAGTTFAWTASGSSGFVTGYSGGNGSTIQQTLINSGVSIETVTYAITPTMNGCDGSTVNHIVTVHPVPDIQFSPSSLTVCSATLIAVNLSSGVAGATYTWTASGSSGNVSGYSNGTGTLINQTLHNSGTTTESATYVVTPSANGCPGPNGSYSVTIHPVPDLANSPPSKSICNNLNTDVTLTSNVSGTLFTWTATGSTAQVTGFSNNSTPTTTLNQTLVNSGYNIETVTYTLTPVANGCNGNPTPFVVTVYPTPDLSNSPANNSQCNNLATGINLTSNVAGTLFTWTATGSTAQVTGFSDNAIPTNFLNQTLVNSGYAIETVTYTLLPEANGCASIPADFTVTVFPTPDLSNSPANKSQCNNVATGINLTSNVSGTLFTWTATGSTAQVTGFSDNAVPTANLNQTLENSGNNTETVTYTLTPVANGCNGTPTPFVVSVYPTPDLSNAPASQSQCNNQATGINLTSNVSGTTFTWTATGSTAQVTGFSDNSTPSTTLNQTLVNSGYNTETVTYTLTPAANGCDGNTTPFVVTVYPTPDLSNSPASSSQCNNLATGINLTSNIAGTLFTWTATGSTTQVTGFSNNSTPTAFLDQTLVNTGNNIETVTYTLTPVANGCSGNPTPYIVTVNPSPDLSNSPASKSQCNNLATGINLTSNVSGTLFTWTATGSTAQVTGFSNNSTPTTTLNQTIFNSGYNIETVSYTLTPMANGCNGTPTPFLVTVYPTPDLSNLPASKTQCNNQPTGITLTSNVSGTTFTWTATGSTAQVTGFSNNPTPSTTLNQTLINSGYNIETVTYTLTPLANGCNGNPTPFTVTVNPSPDLSNSPANKSQCNNLATGITLTSNVSGTLFTWTASGSTAQVTGFSNNATPTSLLDQTLINSGNNTETVTYTLTPVANGCNGNPTPFTVTIFPTPLVSTSPMAQTICTNGSILCNLTSTVSGSTFAWICTASSPNLSGYSNGNTNQISQTLVNAGFTVETVTYSITPTANGCNGPVANFVATVNPRPNLSNNPAASQICSGTSPMVNLTSDVAGANFSWTATGSSGFVSGYGPGSGTLINQVLTNSGFSVETVTYRVTPTANGCSGNLFDYVVSIVSVPDVYFSPTAQTICSNQASSIQVLSHVVGATFTWTASASSPNLSGYSGGSGPLIAQTVLNTGSTIEAVTYTATPAAFGCPDGPPQSIILTVNPRPSVTNPIRSSSICSASATNILLQANVAGSTYAWTATGSTVQVSGYGPGSGNQIQQLLTNSGFNLELVTYVVTATANSCPGDTSHFQVTVFPVADAYYTPLTQAICPAQTTNVLIASHVAGATFTWTASGSSLFASGYAPGSGSLVQQTLGNTGHAIETVTYHVTPVANGCTGTASNLLITVNPDPVATFSYCWDEITTTDAQPIQLKGAQPLGGTFSGTGVVGSTFYPSIAGVGSFPVTYRYTNTYGCDSSEVQTITVISPVSITCGNTFTDPRDNMSYETVQLGTQCWMATNLNYGSSVNSAQMQRDNCAPEKYCYGDNASNCANMGGLYQWDELVKYNDVEGQQGFCPPGWHLPSETEWGTLFNFFISNGFAGSALKSTGYSGYNAFLNGTRFKNSSWNFLDFATFFWSSTPRGTFKAWAHAMNAENPSVSYYPATRNNAFSVRCVKD